MLFQVLEIQLEKSQNLIFNLFGEENLFITHETVSKLLIQNQEPVTNKPKEIIDLNGLESALSSNPMIKKAQGVFQY